MNKLMESLTQSTQLGLCIMYPSPGVIERIGGDWDWIWIDGQHGELDYTDMLALVRAADFVGKPSFVRVPGQDAGWVGRALDLGATAVIVPMVESVMEAQAMVKAAKFPPLGNRSYGGRRPIDLKGRGYSMSANTEALLILQIESPDAAEQAEAIASLPGVDGLFLGMDDYVIRQGRGVDDPKTKETVGRAYELVGDACRRHGKVFCAVGAGELALRLCLESGCNLIVAGGDVGFLAMGSKNAAEFARQLVASSAPSNTPKPMATLY